jgi:ceramide glucosyltransferase
LSRDFVYWGLGLWWLVAGLVHVVTALLPRRRSPVVLGAAPPVSVLVPVKGVDGAFDATIATLFRQEYRDYELLFLLAERGDPARPPIERAIAAHPSVPARLLIGEAALSANPKVNNLAKGEAAARHGLVMMCDANVALAPNTIARLVPLLAPGVGLVQTIPVALDPEDFVGELEAAMFNGFAARWLFAADFFGIGAGLGKIMLLRQSDLARIGGVPAMAEGLCEDTTLADAIAATGLAVTVAPDPAFHPIGKRRWQEFWDRHLRWHCCRRCHRLATFLVEPLLAAALPTIAGAVFWTHVAGATGWTIIPATLAFWLGVEALYLRRQGWPFSWRAPAAWLLREILLPALWLDAARRRSLVWRGSRIAVRTAAAPAAGR